MNKTVKIILKIFLIILCAFIVFEICGAFANIWVSYVQHKKVLEIIENNNGEVWDIYSYISHDYIDEIHFAATDVIVHSENIDNISSTLSEEFVYDHEHGYWAYGVRTNSLEPFEPFWTYGDTDYSKHYEKINAKLRNRNNENYYIITIGGNLPFKHNIITKLTLLKHIDPSIYRI
ncbi:MAG: hypothetical protein K2K44_01250 [Oscillospiraceae bacterium]|nr:hypothetical protein [Oscillospiraceae bacterium]